MEFHGTRHDLIEQNFGEAEGLPLSRLPTVWESPESVGAELGSEVGRRGGAALTNIVGDFPSARLVVVSHGGLIRRTLSAITGTPFESAPRVENASAAFLRHDGATWRLEEL